MGGVKLQPNSQDLPPEAQKKVRELQKQKEEFRKINERKNQFKAEDRRIKGGLDALEDAEEDSEVFRVSGPVGIKTDKSKLEKELTGKRERIESKIESMEDKESEIEEKAKENQSELRQMLSGGQRMG